MCWPGDHSAPKKFVSRKRASLCALGMGFGQEGESVHVGSYGRVSEGQCTMGRSAYSSRFRGTKSSSSVSGGDNTFPGWR
jgi:hypothetical protein